MRHRLCQSAWKTLRNAFACALLSTALSLPAVHVVANDFPVFQNVPENWRPEVIPFPLGFAPDIKLKGVEELRFAPGMFQDASPEYFTYAFIWWLEGEPKIDSAQLERDLLRYFQGLYKAVSEKEDKSVDDFRVTVAKQPATNEDDTSRENYTGTAVWLDPFVTEASLTLNMKISQWYCAERNRAAVMFHVSPQPFASPVWNPLRSIRAGRCTTPPLTKQAQTFRALLDDEDYAGAQALMAEDARRWWEKRDGQGGPWTLGPDADPWSGWDKHFNARKKVLHWEEGDRWAKVAIAEVNDFFRLTEREPVTSEIVYFYNEAGKIDGLLIRATGKRPLGKTTEFLVWARKNEQEELLLLMPGGDIDPSGDHPQRFRLLLNRWREATGLEKIE